MQTLSLFPSLLDFQMLGIFMIRATLGFIFVYFWYEKIFLFRKDQIHFYEKLGLRPAKIFSLAVASLEGITGVLLIIGLYTQAAAIVAGAIMTLAVLIKWRTPSALPKNTNDFYVILAVASLSLLFLGAGAFAIDLPL